MATSLAFVFEFSVWALLAVIAMGDFSAARSKGETARVWVVAKYLLMVVFLVAMFATGSKTATGDANPLMFEYLVLLLGAALMAHDARARGEWLWSGRVYLSFAVLAVILALTGRYVVTASLAFSNDGAGPWMWLAVVASLVFGVAPLIAYVFARGPRLDGLTPTVTFVKGVMGGSSVNPVMVLPRIIIGVVILAGILINGGNVIGRYVYLAPIIWAEEIMIYGMVWTVFIGAVLVTWDSRHLKMDLLSTTLPSPYKEILAGLGVVMFLVVCAIVVPQNWTVFSMMYRLDQRSIVAEIPMSIPHFALLLGFVMMFLAVAVRFRRQISGNLETEIDDLVADEDSQSPGPAAGG
jgi:TRAP-type C4-dicarboxylate transport system permease small subunit